MDSLLGILFGRTCNCGRMHLSIACWGSLLRTAWRTFGAQLQKRESVIVMQQCNRPFSAGESLDTAGRAFGAQLQYRENTIVESLLGTLSQSCHTAVAVCGAQLYQQENAIVECLLGTHFERSSNGGTRQDTIVECRLPLGQKEKQKNSVAQESAQTVKSADAKNDKKAEEKESEIKVTENN